MFNVLTYQRASALSYTLGMICQCENDVLRSPVYLWLLTGKLAENPQVQPSNKTQVITPSGINKYLQSVTVKAQNPMVFTVSVVDGATTTVPIANSVTATSDTAATATATVSGGVVTVTGVAAGTTAIRVYDVNESLIGIIVATVTAA